jgi:SH3-like domain-containing protein
MMTRAARMRRPFRLVALLALGLAVAPAAPVPAGESAARGPVTNLPLPRFVSMRAETANARRGPSLSHRVDWTFVHRGQPLEITAEYGHWRRVRDAEGAGGWVHHTLLSGVRTVLIRGEGAIALRAGPREGTAIRAMAEPGVIARLETCDPESCRGAAGGVTGWLPRAVLWGVEPDEDFAR